MIYAIIKHLCYQALIFIIKASNMADIEKIAHETCFSTDYTVKSNGQQFFYNLCQSITNTQLGNLINNYSPTVLFIALEYVHKVLATHKDLKELFLVIANSAEAWFTNTATFVRKDQKVLQHYAQKSLGRTLGGCLKFLYLKQNERQWVKMIIKECKNHRFRLYLEINFIQEVSIIDRNLSFLEYRSLVYTFQEQIIPIMMDHLIPFFQSVKEQIQIHELSQNLETTLSLQINSYNEHSLMFTKSEEKFSALVFQILKQIVCFNYNITYSQFESQTPIENCLICYPDAVCRKIVSSEFITSIFYVIGKLADEKSKQSEQELQLQRTTSSSSSNTKFLSISLECLSKIALTKLSYINQTKKREFIKNFVSGINRLLKIIGNFSDQFILMIIEANTKLLINIQLYELRRNEKQFFQWISHIRQTLLTIITNVNISIENGLLLQCLQLATKIVGQAVSPHLKQQIQKFKDFGLEIFKAFLLSFTKKEHQLLGYMNNISKVKNFEDLKKGTIVLFKKIKMLLTLNLRYSLPLLEEQVTKILNNQVSFQIPIITNLFFFIGDLCQLGIFQRNILYQDPDKQMFPIFGKIVYYLIQWIQLYRNNGSKIEILEVAIILFCQKLASQILNQFNTEGKSIKINGKLFQAIKSSQNHLPSDQQFLYFCFKQFAISLTNGNFTRVSYTFDVLGTILIKFKCGLKRQSFKQTLIAKSVLSLCLQMSQQNFEGELLKLRKKLFKIITSISFDDILDDYHENIDILVSNLEVAFRSNRWKVLYDLTGICQAIDIPTIYRYFIMMLIKKLPIQAIFDDFFSNSQDNQEIITQILKLQLAMVDNKSHKLSGIRAARINYSLHDKMIKYWIVLLNRATTDSYEDILIYLYKILVTMIKGHHLNFFLLQRVCSQYSTFIQSIINNLILVGQWVNLYPELQIIYRDLYLRISQEIMPIILSTDQSLIFNFNLLFEQILGQTASQLQQLKSMQHSSQNNEKQIQNNLSAIGNIFKYIRDERKMTHKIDQLRNISQGIIQVNLKLKFQFLVICFQFGIQNKAKKYLQKICFIIQQMDFICYNTFDELIRRLGVTQQRVNVLKDIWGLVDQSNIQANQENNYEFQLRIKEWFRKCDSDTMTQPDY